MPLPLTLHFRDLKKTAESLDLYQKLLEHGIPFKKM